MRIPVFLEQQKDPNNSFPPSQKCPSSSENSSKRLVIPAFGPWIWMVSHFCLIQFPLSMLLGTCCITWGIQSLYETYSVPLMNRATRTDEDLEHEFTYYHRRCTAQDITTRNLTELMVNFGPSSPSNSYGHPDDEPVTAVETAQQLLMTHGAVLIPRLLQPDTIRRLREYAVHRNNVIPEHEQYPVSQGHRRISFGYDATEHPALVQAIREVTHNTRLRQLLQQVLGDHDPASTEITTLTQYYGAPPQVWHGDTKTDGNALKFARTYSHSYSLFLPLQNTSRLMGATEVCPGTHYCADDLMELCDATFRGQGLHAAYPPEETFPAGDGALLNQHVWHRGAAHQDPHAPERIVLVLTFIARPQSGDPRQLSRGTYFHQKWNMWGHTWRDLMDPYRYMKAPYSYLKCLGLWSANANWGYDFVTAVLLRVANGQLGGDLTRFVHIWDTVLQWPEWLHGSNYEYEVAEKEAWQIFLQETMVAVNQFLQRVALGLHLTYIIVVMLLYIFVSKHHSSSTNDVERRQQTRKWIRMTVARYMIANGIFMFVMFALLHRIRQSKRAMDIAHGKTLMRPFPPSRSKSFREDLWSISSSGPTTYPMRNDILIGTRLDTPWLGAYEHWLQEHPGNRQFRNVLKRLGPMLDNGLSNQTSSQGQSGMTMKSMILESVIATVDTELEGRFLQQDYSTGDWRIQSKQETIQTISLELACAASPLLSVLRIILDRSISHYRFGTMLRSSALARSASIYAWHLRGHLAGVPLQRSHQDPSSVIANSQIKTSSNGSEPTRKLELFQLEEIPRQGLSAVQPRNWRLGWRMLHQRNSNGFRVGQRVWIHDYVYDEDGEKNFQWYLGDIMELDDDKEATVAFDWGEVEEHIPVRALKRFSPVQEGDFVRGCFSYETYLRQQYEYDDDEEDEDMSSPPSSKLEDCYDGEIVRVMPDGAVSIEYSDGDYDSRKPPDQYFIPPFQYEIPDE